MKKFDLRKWRLKHNMTQTDFAVLTKSARNRVSRAENGKAPKALGYFEVFTLLYDIPKERKNNK